MKETDKSLYISNEAADPSEKSEQYLNSLSQGSPFESMNVYLPLRYLMAHRPHEKSDTHENLRV